MILLNLIQNIALLLALTVVHQVFVQTQTAFPWRKAYLLSPVLSGLIFGGLGIVGMMTPLHWAPGIIFDSRSIILAVAGLFGGPVVGCIAAILCGGYRLWLGGGGILMGLSVISASAGVGVLFHYLRKRHPFLMNNLPLLGFGFLVHIIMVGCMLLLPEEKRWEALHHIGPPVLLLYPVATMVICRLFADRETHLKNELALRESEEKYRSLVRYSGDPIFSFDREGHYLFVNEAFARPFLKSPEEIIGKTPHFIFSPDEAELRLASVREVFATGKGKEIEVRIDTHTGMTRYYLTIVDPIHDDNGNITSISCISKDITLRKRAEERLKRINASLLELGPDFEKNVMQLTALCGELLGATCAFYNRLENGMFRSVGQWHTPHDYVPLNKPDGYICYAVIQQGSDAALLVRDLTQTPYVVTDPNVMRCGLKTYLGHKVRCSGDPVGSICVLFQHDFEPTDDDRHLLSIIASSLGSEEERKRAAETLKQQTDAMEAAIDGMALLDANRSFISVNKAHAKIYGYDCAGDLLGKSWQILYTEEELQRFDREIMPELQRSGQWQGRSVGRKKDGTTFPKELSLNVLDTNGMICVVRDITERKQAEENLVKSERTLRRIFDILPVGLWFADKKGKLLSGNLAGVKMWGGEPHVDPSNYSVFKARRLPQREEIAADDWALARTIREGVTVIDELLEIDAFDGQKRIILNSTAPVQDDDGTILGAIVVNQDISDRKRAEEERERLEDQLRQALKMEAIGQLAGGIAHDFNNLLQVILGHVEGMQNELRPDSPEFEPIGEVRRAAERAANLTRQLLAFSRRQIIQPINLDLNELIEGVLKMIRRVIGEHIELHFLSGNRLGVVHADKGQIEQILMNLCVNARDAMPNGGTLTIETENVVIGKAYCREHPWATEGRYVLLSVTDTGCGIDEGTRLQIFEPFFTTKEIGQGTGLGLATVYGIVKQHTGFIQVYSELGKGTAFKVYLPIVERPAEEVGSKVPELVTGGTETILLAEDEEMVRNLVCRMLKTAGYTVLGACDGEDAMQVFEENVDQIELAILDVMMPKLGGREVMDRIREKRPHIRFLFSSGYSENAIHTNFVMKEGLHLITKPYRKSDLLRAVREALDVT